MTKIALRYSSDRNVYHVVMNDKEGTHTRSSLENLGSHSIILLADRAARERPDQWCHMTLR